MKNAWFLFFSFICFSVLYSEETICTAVADNSIAAHGSELNENVGNTPRLKIKGSENYPIIKFDLSKIPNDAKIEKAELIIEVTDPKMVLRQIGCSTVPIDWVEGEGAKPDNKSHGFACYKGAQGPETGWGKKGANFLDVTGGNMGSISYPVLVNKEGDKYIIPLTGRFVAAMKKDQIGGLTLSDESGWWGGTYSNIYIHSREAGAKGPQLKVFWSKSTDKKAPSAPKIKQVIEPLDEGDVMLEIICGGNDDNVGAALGYDMRISEGESFDWATATPVHRMNIPRPLEAGQKFRHLLSKLKPGSKQTIGIQAYDEAGNVSAIEKVTVVVTQKKVVSKPEPDSFTFEAGGPLVSEGLLQIFAIDEISKISPIDGKILIDEKFEEPTYKNGNLFWNGKSKNVTLKGGKGEYVSFQLVLENISNNSINAITFKTSEFKSGANTFGADRIRLLREWYVNDKDSWFTHALPLLNDKNKGALQLPYADNVIPNQKLFALYVEIFVPYTAAVGTYDSFITVNADGKEIKVPLKLDVLNYEIPKELSFVVELNAYGVSGKSKRSLGVDDEKALADYKSKQQHFFNIHRLAHEFRASYNALGYSHSGGESVPYIPKVKGLGKDAVIEDWSEWDEWMGPLLSGELFKDLPRGAVPIVHQYMPFYENYPMPVTEYLGGKIHNKRRELKDDKLFMPFMCENDVLVEDGFSQAWKDGMKTIGQAYRKHFEEKGWFKTEFQLFCNNKVFKGKEQATSLWTLDEPTFGRDFRALGYLGKAMKSGFEGSKLNVLVRADISRPSAQGNRTDGGVDLIVMSGGFYGNYPFISKRMKELGEQYWVYGGAKAQNLDPTQVLSAYVKMWRMGCNGGLVYWTSFAGASWDEINELAVVLKGEHGYKSVPTASHTLAVERRAQQDIELMNLLSKKEGWNRQIVAEYVDQAVNLASSTSSKNAEDPGQIKFHSVSAEKMNKLRLCLQQELVK